jgi:hypothetical protein
MFFSMLGFVLCLALGLWLLVCGWSAMLHEALFGSSGSSGRWVAVIGFFFFVAGIATLWGAIANGPFSILWRTL